MRLKDQLSRAVEKLNKALDPFDSDYLQASAEAQRRNTAKNHTIAARMLRGGATEEETIRTIQFIQSPAYKDRVAEEVQYAQQQLTEHPVLAIPDEADVSAISLQRHGRRLQKRGIGLALLGTAINTVTLIPNLINDFQTQIQLPQLSHDLSSQISIPTFLAVVSGVVIASIGMRQHSRAEKQFKQPIEDLQ